MPRGKRLKLFLRGLGKFIALVVVAGAVGVGLGMGLSQLSGDTDSATPVIDAASTPDATTSVAANPPITPTRTAEALPPATTTAPATTATTTTATTPSAPSGRFAQVRVDVLDARLHTDETPSGTDPQPARVTVRVRADNAGSRGVKLDPPSLRVGSVRVPVDTDAAAARFDPLSAGGTQTVTLRFALEGEATPKLVRDRRARILIAGRSLAIRIKVRSPS